MEMGFWENAFNTVYDVREIMLKTYYSGTLSPQFETNSMEYLYALNTMRAMVSALRFCEIMDSFNPDAMYSLVDEMTR